MTDLLTERFEGCSKTTGNTERTPPPAPSIPIDEFVDELVKSGLSDEEAASFLDTLVPLMWHFVNVGFEGDIFEVLLPSDDAAEVNLNGSQAMEKGLATT
ncbi:MAG: hypothetical protein AAF234_13575 [Pseudomonadota bacterium]